MKRYGLPLIVIILGSIILYLFRTYLFFAGKSTILAILTATFLFVFGTYLSTYHKKSKGWVKKLLVAFLALCLLLIQLKVIRIPIMNAFLNIIEANSLVFYLLYIYFGYIFF